MTIEHHWHEPTQGQVTKAMYQFFTDLGVTQENLMKLVDSKVREAVAARVETWVNSGKFDDLIVAAVASYVKDDAKAFDRKGGYGLVNHVRDLIRKELTESLLRDYKVTVEKITAPTI